MKRLRHLQRLSSTATAGLLPWILLLALGCGTLGTETAFPGAISSSGVGPFRQLERYETGVFRAPSGQSVDSTGLFLESASVGAERLYYAAAPPLAAPPERDPALPGDVIDWAQAEPRAIYRAAPGGFTGTRDGEPVVLSGFGVGTRVLEASAAWEGDAVFDPCAITLADGRVRLYYAAAGGIGLAEASGTDGTFTRVGDAPILGPDASIASGGVPRSPAVVELEAQGYLLYYDAGDGVRVARSDDGLAFAPVDADAATPAIDPIFTALLEPRDADPVELDARMPGATMATMPGGRRVVRVYFEIPRDDEGRIVSMSASADGITFERYARPSFQTASPGAPRPWLREDGTTLLLTRISRQLEGLEAGASVLSISPANHFLADEP